MKPFITILALCALPALAQSNKAVQVINGLESQRYLGTGKGVIVSVLDSGIDITHPAIRGAVYAEQDFTGQKILDDSKANAGHGTGVAAIMMGHDGKIYSGLAPAARLINARVVTEDDFTTDLWAGNGLIWSAKKGAKVANLSFGNRLGKGDLTDKLNLITDFVTERYGINVVVAAGNENDSAVQQTPGANYNGLTIGSVMSPNYKRVSVFSNYSFDNDVRTKPDLVAPGEAVDIATADWEKDTNYYWGVGTSFASPMVGGVLAQLIGYGRSKDMSTDPLLMKAILMTSATKVRGYEDDVWAAREAARDPDYGYLFTKPLDDEQGAGRVDAMAAYRLYAKKKTGPNVLSTWKVGKMKGNTSVTVSLGKLAAGGRLDATLTWLRHVAVKDKNGNDTPDGKDTFYQSYALADFTLTLLRDGVPIAGSDSDENIEHITWTLEKTANYSLEIYRFVEGGAPSESYALAAQVLKPSEYAVQKALSAKRGLATSSSGALRGMEVPEPTTVGMLAVVALLGLARRRR